MKIALGVVVFVLAFLGCAGDERTFEDVSAVVDALREEGIECDDLETTTEFGPESDALVTERGFCVAGKDRVVISMFENSEDRDDWVAVGKLFGKVAVGENWVAGSDSQQIVKQIAEELDATIPEGSDDEED